STTASIWWAVARPDCSPACRRGGPIGQRPVHRRWFAPRGGCHERLLVEGLAARAPAGASAGRVDPAGLDGRRQSHPGRLRRGLGGERDGPGAGGVGGAARGRLERGRRRAAAGVSGRAAGRRLGQRGLARCADDAGAAPLARATALAALLRAGAVPVAGGAAQHRPARRHPAGFHLRDGGRLPAWRGAALAVSRQRLLSQRRGAGARRSGAGGGGAGRRAGPLLRAGLHLRQLAAPERHRSRAHDVGGDALLLAVVRAGAERTRADRGPDVRPRPPAPHPLRGRRRALRQPLLRRAALARGAAGGWDQAPPLRDARSDGARRRRPERRSGRPRPGRDRREAAGALRLLADAVAGMARRAGPRLPARALARPGPGLLLRRLAGDARLLRQLVRLPLPAALRRRPRSADPGGAGPALRFPSHDARPGARAGGPRRLAPRGRLAPRRLASRRALDERRGVRTQRLDGPRPRRLRGLRRAAMSTPMLGGIFGRPFVDLEPYVDVGELAALDDEISLGLTGVAVGYTGGSHKWMGIVPPSAAHDPYADYGQVIARMSRAELARFVALSDTPEAFDLDRRAEYEFGEERPWPLSRRQTLYLEYRHGVYFPWKVYYELIPNLAWEARAASDGKAFTDEARRVFPRTVAFIERLPFAELGRCNLLGLQSNAHGPIHRDAADEPAVGHFITLCPRGDKRLFL